MEARGLFERLAARAVIGFELGEVGPRLGHLGEAAAVPELGKDPLRRLDVSARLLARAGTALSDTDSAKAHLPERLKQLTDIVWPEIRRLAEAQIAAYRTTEPEAVIVLEAAVLFEAGWEDAVEDIWVVVVDPDIAIERAIERDNVPAELVQKRIDAQLSNDDRKAKADVTIDNSRDLATFLVELDRLWNDVVGA